MNGLVGLVMQQLAGRMSREQFKMHLQSRISVVEAAEPDSLHDLAQCLPSPESLDRQRFFGHDQQAMQSLRGCIHNLLSELAAVMPCLKRRCAEGRLAISTMSRQVGSASTHWPGSSPSME